MRRVHGVLALAALLAASASVRVAAHDIPNDVIVHAFVKPEGDRLRIVVRVPLRAMRDVQFPQRGPWYLDVPRADHALRDAAVQWIAPSIEVYEDAERLPRGTVTAVTASLLSDRSFESYADAVNHVTHDRLPEGALVPWDQVWLDALVEYPIRSQTSRFSIRPQFARLGVRVVTVLRFVTTDGAVRAFEYRGDPGLVRLDPRWHQAAWQFVTLGFFHILDGVDHLLFLLCLVIPFRRIRPLAVIVTAFTIAHSITLIASAWSVAPSGLWFPPLIETLIAASIVYMALENIVTTTTASRRWALAFAFGLVHGFGFSFALKESLQFAGGHLLTSLLSFNLGVELGQLLVLLVLVPALHVMFRVVPERMGTIVLSALVAHTAWHWTADRWARLRQYAWPAMDSSTAVVALRVMMAAVIAAALIWLVWRARRRIPAAVPISRADAAGQSTSRADT